MSLRSALTKLDDDRDTRLALRHVLDYLEGHQRQPVDPEHLARVTGISARLARTILQALGQGSVVDCDTAHDVCTYAPDSILHTEVARYLHTAGRSQNKLQSNVDRFRGRTRWT